MVWLDKPTSTNRDNQKKISQSKDSEQNSGEEKSLKSKTSIHPKPLTWHKIVLHKKKTFSNSFVFGSCSLEVLCMVWFFKSLLFERRICVVYVWHERRMLKGVFNALKSVYVKENIKPSGSLFFQSLTGPHDLIECQGNIKNLYAQNFEHLKTISLETTPKHRS